MDLVLQYLQIILQELLAFLSSGLMKKGNAQLILALVIIATTILIIEKPWEQTPILSENQAPEFTEITQWINTQPLSMEDLRGKVVLIDFWTYTCINCIRTLPYIKEWDEKYSDKGLVIVGVHTPEFQFEKRYDNVIEAVRSNGIEYPVAMDNDFGTWKAYRNRYWPRKYLIDKDGVIRYDHAGEGAYEETEEWIQRLLGEIGENTEGLTIAKHDPNLGSVRPGITGELYTFRDLANPKGPISDDTTYEDSERYALGRIYLVGDWMVEGESALALGPGQIVVPYIGRSVNTVLVSENPTNITLNLDNQDLGSNFAGSDVVIEGGVAKVEVSESRLYNLVGVGSEFNAHLLRIGVETGLELFTFTFGA